MLNGMKSVGGFIKARLSFLVTVRELLELYDTSFLKEDCLLGLGVLADDCDFVLGEQSG